MLFKSPIESFTVGEHVLPIVKTHRKKSIGIKPNANRLELHVPKHLSDRALRTVLNNHIDWISRRLNAFKLKEIATFQFKRNEHLVLLGCEYRFVAQSSDNRQRIQVTAEQKQVCVSVPTNKWPASNKELSSVLTVPLINWYKQQAVAYFEKEMPIYAEQIGVQYSAIQVKSYKSRWGSCYPDGRIQFNWKLIQAPAWVVDYVIVHELCHLKHANHSAAFWNLVETHYANTQPAKKWLKEHQHNLMNFLS